MHGRDFLLMHGRDFLLLATTLAAGSTEAEWRTAVSRAYYAAFHGACDLLFLCGFSVLRAEQAHAYLSLRLGFLHGRFHISRGESSPAQ